MGNNGAVAKQLFVPGGLSIGARLPESNFKDLPKYYYFLDLLHRERVFNKSYLPDDFIRLKAAYLRNVLNTKKALKVITDLQQWGIIEIDPSYSVGTKSKGYRLTDQYRGRPVQAVSLTDKVLLKNLNKHNRIEFEETDLLLWQLSNYTDQVQVDYTGASQYIFQKFTTGPRLVFTSFSFLFQAKNVRLTSNKVNKTNISNKKPNTPPYDVTFIPSLDGLTPKTGKNWVEFENFGLFSAFPIIKLSGAETRFTFASIIKPAENLRWFDYCRINTGYQARHYNSDLITLQMLASREPSDIIFKRDTVGNRLHTNLTNMSANLRPFLSHQTGEQLVNLDIRNSQPLFFATLLKDRYRKRSMPADVALYIDLTRRGEFYEYVMDLCNVPATKEDRKAFKKAFFGHVFFCHNQHMASYPDAKIFQDHFPNVYQVIRIYKFKDYKQLAIQMQRRESRIIIDLVCAGLLKDYGPGFFCLTIHDSIVTVKSNQAIVKERIERVFLTEYGIKPTVTPEDFN